MEPPEDLVGVAVEYSARAYAPYSRFSWGRCEDLGRPGLRWLQRGEF
nr:hypothetical protein [Aeropyrum camini]